jgi:AraC-like DNA-binding protein
MNYSQSTLELITASFGSSFAISSFGEMANEKSRFWHHHPEIELVFVNGGSGKRKIGSHISYYNNGDLILIGSNLPHFGLTNDMTRNENETVIQMKPDFLGDFFFDIPEMKNIKNLLNQSRGGIAFGEDVKRRIGPMIELMTGQMPFQRLISILEILNDLAHCSDYKVLNADGFSLELHVQDNKKINTIFNYVKENYKQAITLEEISELVSMTTPSFCRYFKKITSKTFVTFVNEYRLVHASKLLAEKPISINEVSIKCGFNNFSHFDKLFKDYTGKSPSQYRQEHKLIL